MDANKFRLSVRGERTADQSIYKTRTRNSECLIRLPCIKTEYARKSFYFMGAKRYNKLPIDFRKAESFKQNEDLLRKQFI